ncbi:MAG TPA: pirin family protein [Candidatus Rifleibacterium sp.]|nr:pirin family protein [Candidatus Rifleibacterium sp.]
MKDSRKIRQVVKGIETHDGAGVRLVRVFAHKNVVDFDPFLMMDAFDNSRPEDYEKGFPWHPHRGIETITYLIEGKVEHGDSLGNKGTIFCGDCQWMTAGSGIIHQEMPKPPGKMLGVQIWLNMPASNKMGEPAYGDIVADKIPLIKDQNCEIRLISGSYKGTEGAFRGRYVKPLFMDVNLPAETDFELETPAENTVFSYNFYGSGIFSDGKEYAGKTTLLFEQGELLQFRSGKEGLRMIILSGPPLKEPVAWGGPIVMNTQEELDLAFEEIETGQFIKHRR